MDANTKAVEGLLELAAARGLSADWGLEQAERLFRDLSLEIGARSLEQHLEQQKPGYEGTQRPCPDCDGWQRFVQHRPRRLETMLGSIQFKRAYYRCPHCGCGSLPFDEQAGLARTCMSAAVAKAATWCAAHEPFAQAATKLAELAGIKLSASTVHRLMQRVGAAAQSVQSPDAPQTHRVEAAPKRHYTTVDGAMVHIDGRWQEVRVAACYWRDKKDHHVARFCVRHDSAEAFAPHVQALARRTGHFRAQEPLLLGDGARWIWHRVAALLRPDTTHITDWYHVMEHVWACARALHGDDDAQARAWVRPIETMLWEGRLRDLRRHLHDQRAAAEGDGGRRQALRSLAHYIRNQGDRLVYDDFRAAGCDIGSGVVESACDHVVAQRGKRSGMRWSSRGLQNTMAVRTSCLNGYDQDLWAEHPLRFHLLN